MNSETLDDVMLPSAELAPSLAASSSRSFREFVRYVAASVVALATDTSTLALFTSVFGMPYLVSGALSFSLGIIVIYFLSVRWVFEHRLVANSALEFSLFALVGAVGLGINEAVLWVGTGYLGFFYLVSKCASIAIVFSWNYTARKFLLFRKV